MLLRLPAVSVIVALSCGAAYGSINQGKDLSSDDDDSASDTGATGDSGGDDDSSGGDSSGGDDSKADDSTVIDDSGGGDDTEDSEAETWPGSCGNFWDPVDIGLLVAAALRGASAAKRSQIGRAHV